MKNLTKESLEAILDDVFSKHVSKLQKPDRERIPDIDANGKFVRREL